MAARPTDVPVPRWWREYVLHLAALNERTELSREQHRLVLSVPVLHTRRLAIIREYEDLLTAAIEADAPPSATRHIRGPLERGGAPGGVGGGLRRVGAPAAGWSLRALSTTALDVALADFLPAS